MIRNLLRDVEQAGMSSNAFLVTGERPMLVDVGTNFDAVDIVRNYVDDLDGVVLTHTHYDHVGNLEAVTEAFDVDVWGFDPTHEGVDHAIADGEFVTLGDHEFEAIHTPGHKDDHLCFYAESTGVLFAGDLVFANGGFGRTDLAEGDRATLVKSIERLLERTGEVTELYTGHGPSVITNPRHDIETALQAAKMGL